MNKQRLKRPFYRRKPFLWAMGAILSVIIFILVLFRLTPWPGAMIIRVVFDKGGAKTRQSLDKHPPNTPVATITDQSYGPNDSDAKLDVYFPDSVKSTSQRLPVIIWTHGGAWLSGNKADAAGYFKLLAAEGYTIIAPNYSLAPGHTYPAPIHQLNEMYAYIQLHAGRFHSDTSKVFLAGDSAGSQLSSQMAAIITNPAYAREVAIKPALKPAQLRGIILNCGIYQMRGLTQPNPTLSKVIGWGDDVSVWAYAGTKDFSDPVIRQMSAYYHVTSAFPATYIGGGNGDPLTQAQSVPFTAKLESLGVPVTKLFYAKDHQPSLPHEYQFNLDTADGVNALKATLAFIKSHAQ
jgi:acetyl esterase/lipase